MKNLTDLFKLIQILKQETIDFHKYLDDYQIDIDEELILLSIKNKPELIEELKSLTFEDYMYVMETVVQAVYKAIYGCEEIDY